MKSFVDTISVGSSMWSAEVIEKLIKDFCESNKISFRQIGIPLRVLITGSSQSASITDILGIIGKEDSISRLKIIIERLK